MSRGRKADSDVLRIVKGSSKKSEPTNPDPATPRAAQKVPSAPRTLSKEGKKLWRVTCKKLIDAGLLAETDIGEIELYCDAWEQHRKASEHIEQHGETAYAESGYEYLSPWVTIKKNAATQILKISQNFGLNPTARKSVVKAKGIEDETNPFDKFGQTPPRRDAS